MVKLKLKIFIAITKNLRCSCRFFVILMDNCGYYRTTVDAIENSTGYDFLSNVSASIQSAVEAQVDNGPIQ